MDIGEASTDTLFYARLCVDKEKREKRKDGKVPSFIFVRRRKKG
jgi:hypothetical protein